MITKNIKNKILEYFLENPNAKLRVRQIEKVIGVPLPSAIRYCKELEKECILKIDKISNIVFYTADKSSKKFILEKKLFNLKNIFNSGLIDYLIREYSNPPVVLFGSFLNGEDIEESDIDLYIETPKKEKFDLEKFEKFLKRKIQIFNYSGIKKIPNKELANNILNGYVLNEFMEVFNG